MKTINELVSQMTINEKAAFLVGSASMSTKGIERLGIQSIEMCDGPHGVRILSSNSNGVNTDAVCIPCLSALGATWNEELVYKIGQALAAECIRFNKDLILGPGLNMKRTDLCGRNFEYFSEDPIHTGILGSAYVNGVQSSGVGACAKHFAANNQETDRLHISAEIDERTLREIYLKAFRYVIKNSSPAAVMCSYNKVNSILCSENKMLFDILKKEWEYKGFVVSDWACCKNAVRSVKAGLDLAMPNNAYFVPSLLKGLEAGEITEEEINDSVKRILEFVVNKKSPQTTLTREDCHAICRQAAEESIVLLKNEDDLLPITKEKYKRIAVVGEFAERPIINGYGSANVNLSDDNIESPLEFIKEYCESDIQVDYYPLYKIDEYLEKSQFAYLSDLNGIENADLVLMFVGREKSVEAEGTDRATSHLNPLYEFFIKSIYPKNQNIALIVQSGGAFLQLSWQHKVKAIAQMWLGGEAAGSAIANVLFGKVNPSGRLSETFPKKTRTDIDWPGDGYKVCYDEKWRIGYRYYDLHTDEIWYPFGFGLSYTNFEYSNLNISNDNDGFSVRCTIKNIGDVAGKEIVQVYFSDKISTASRPIKELISFKKTALIKSGESVELEFRISNADLAYYNTTLHKWVTEPGIYEILVAASSQDIRLKGEYLYKGDCEYTINYDAEQIIG